MVRLSDIAQKTGYTISTISKALNHSSEISQETSKIIWNAAREMGYVSRKSMKRAEKTIGVIIQEVESQYYTRLLNAVSKKIMSSGYKMITVINSDYWDHIGASIDQISKYMPDGIITCSGDTVSDDDMEKLLDTGIPSLIINELPVSFPTDSICIDPSQSMRLAIEHLQEMGHEKIGYLGEYNSDSRYEHFIKVMEQHNLFVDTRFVKRGSDRFERGGYILAKELMEEKELPTAIIAGYDQFAIGAMKLFQENGIRIPEDMAILGFDNIVLDEYLPVTLTSVTNPVEQMGATAVKLLLDAIKNPKTHVVQTVTLQSRLIVRSSTRPGN